MQGRREEALAEFQKGRTISLNSPNFISLLGNVSAQAGMTMRAVIRSS
jgi:hypothetical protein